MTQKEIVTALREHAEWAAGNEWETPITLGDDLSAAADLNENQQREIEALRQANEGLRFNLAEKDGGEICRRALEAFGAQAQVMMAIEEMSELTKELCKNGREKENATHIAEEIADVEIMLRQMVMLFDCAGQVETFRRYKLERLAERIKEAKKWAAAHPRKTRQSVFLEQWPEAKLDKDGVLHICPSFMGGKIPEKYRCICSTDCGACRCEFWNQEVE